MKRNGFERKNPLVFYHDILLCYQNGKCPHGQYAHSGIKVQPKTRKNDKFEKRAISLKDSSPASKADFSKK